MTRHTNILWANLAPGMQAQVTRTATADDFFVFANNSGNINPMHLLHEDADHDGQRDGVAPSLWVGSLISAVLGNHLPGPGTLYRAQSFRFLAQAHEGDVLTAHVRLTELRPPDIALFDTWVETAEGTRIVEGEAEVKAPTRTISVDLRSVPGLTVQTHLLFDRMLEEVAPLPALRCAVVAPEDANSLGGALLARDHGILDPVLIGDAARIRAAAAELGADISALELIDIAGHRPAAARAVALVHEGRVRAIMKGNLHSDDLLSEIVKRDGGLRDGRRLSHVFVMDVPGLDHLLMVTDAAINIAPDLDCKVDIVQNAIDLAHALGIAQPKVGILSAVETVNPRIPSTLDAAILSKMAERGQIRGGIVDGPLAMDNAVDLEAARTKGIASAVAGHAEILVVPNLEAGNMLAKELTFLAHAQAAGIVVGARCPIILTSRADDERSRLASCAVAALMERGMKRL